MILLNYKIFTLRILFSYYTKYYSVLDDIQNEDHTSVIRTLHNQGPEGVCNEEVHCSHTYYACMHT